MQHLAVNLNKQFYPSTALPLELFLASESNVSFWCQGIKVNKEQERNTNHFLERVTPYDYKHCI